MTNRFYFSVGAIFKNEALILKEWIEHYLYHGAEHFYLINDNSDDNSLEVIQEYIDKNLITLFNVNEEYYLGRQRNLYNRHILPCI
jgi:glycosyltransferase involved in cell wall biosynthesis